MVFVNDFRKEFYDVVQNERVLILVAMDVDALCACQILKTLFQYDQILYTVVPIGGIQELETAYSEHSEGIEHIVFLNCGATLDLVDMLGPRQGVVFYICDSHRPVHVNNIYNQVQVHLLVNADELEGVPEFDQIFREDESSSDDSDSDQPARFTEEKLERRRERRLWRDKRGNYLFEYTRYSSHGTSAAFLMFELAWKMSKDTNDLLWLSIVGVTSQFLYRQVDRDKYIEDIGQLQGHVSRHNHKADSEENAPSIDTLKISFTQELRFTLYRHWTLMASITHSTNIATKFQLWNVRGKSRLHEYLADMGLPLTQCEQKYNSMELSLKQDLKDRLGSQAHRYHLTDTDMFLPSFQAHYGYRNKFCAADFVHACSAVLESVDNDTCPSENFLKALRVLRRSDEKVVNAAIETAKLQLIAIGQQTQSLLDINQITCLGPFLYTFLPEGTADIRLFSKPICLQSLAQFALGAYGSMLRSKKAHTLPLVMGAPLDSDEGTIIIIGIPPINDKSYKNLFHKAFEAAAKTTFTQLSQDFFDMHIASLKTGDKDKFFEALMKLLA